MTERRMNKKIDKNLLPHYENTIFPYIPNLNYLHLVQQRGNHSSCLAQIALNLEPVFHKRLQNAAL